MQVNKYDIRFALEHLLSHKKAPYTNFTLSYLDALARQILLQHATDRHVSEDAAQLAQQYLLMPQNNTVGACDAALKDLCVKIIVSGTEEDFIELLKADPRKISAWRSLWDKTRAKAAKAAQKKRK